MDQGERRHRSGLDAECRLHLLRLAEAEAPKAKRFCQALQVHSRIFFRDDQDEAVVLVPQEKVLGVGARKRAAKSLGLC